MSVEKQGGLAILPNVNLIQNIGYGEKATHTKTPGRYSEVSADEIKLPLVHPQKMEIDKKADVFSRYYYFQEKPANLVWFYKIPEAKTKTVYLGYSTAFRQMPSLAAQKEKPFLLYVGMRVHYKNFSNLIKAYAKWKRKHEINLVVVGKPWSDEEIKSIHGLGLEENVQIKMNITDAELCKLYNDAVALVYPSLYEGFGIPLLEASACACPIIASRIPSTQEIIGSMAVYFDPLDIESMLDALEKSFNLRHDPKYIQIARNYSWDRAAKETFGLYQDLL